LFTHATPTDTHTHSSLITHTNDYNNNNVNNNVNYNNFCCNDSISYVYDNNKTRNNISLTCQRHPRSAESKRHCHGQSPIENACMSSRRRAAANVQ